MNTTTTTTTTTTVPVGRITLRNARLAFPTLFVPKANDNGVLNYGCALILGPDHPQLGAIKAAMDAAGAAKWGDKWPAQKKALVIQDRMALHDGDLKAKYDGYEGNLFINANAKESEKPTVFDQARNPLTAASGKPYAGCYVNASVEFWPQKDHPLGGSRINAQLRGVQFLRDGDAFAAGRPADADDFEDVTEGVEADDFA